MMGNITSCFTTTPRSLFYVCRDTSCCFCLLLAFLLFSNWETEKEEGGGLLLIWIFLRRNSTKSQSNFAPRSLHLHSYLLPTHSSKQPRLYVVTSTWSLATLARLATGLLRHSVEEEEQQELWEEKAKSCHPIQTAPPPPTNNHNTLLPTSAPTPQNTNTTPSQSHGGSILSQPPNFIPSP